MINIGATCLEARYVVMMPVRAPNIVPAMYVCAADHLVLKVLVGRRLGCKAGGQPIRSQLVRSLLNREGKLAGCYRIWPRNASSASV